MREIKGFVLLLIAVGVLTGFTGTPFVILGGVLGVIGHAISAVTGIFR